MKPLRLVTVLSAAALSLLLTGCLPIPVIDVGQSSLRAEQSFTADGSGTIVSNVPAGTVAVSFRWDLGDGTTARGEQITHTYAKPGTYTIELTVVDSAGRSASTEESVTVLPALPGVSTDEAEETEEDSADAT